MENISNIAQGNPYGYIKDQKIYLKPFLDYKEREIGVVKESEENSILYFVKRFDIFLQKVNALFDAIDKAENKGSYLQKLLYLKEQCGKFDALGDFESVYHRLSAKEAELNDLITKNRLKNLGLKQALLKELETIKDSNDWINASEAIKEIKVKWIRIGSVDKTHEEELNTQYKNYLNTFFERRQAFYDERKVLTESKIAKYKQLLDQSEALKSEQDLKNLHNQVKKLKEEWKEVGIVPKAMLAPILKSFKKNIKALQSKLKANQKTKNFDTDKNTNPKLKAHIDLLKQVEAILTDMPPGGDDQVRKIFEQWKLLGNVRGVPEFKALDDKFKRRCARALDLYYLNKLVFRKAPNFKSLSPKEQTKVKIGIMKEMVARDRENIENFENTFSKQASNSKDSNFEKVFGSKLLIQKRNLESKEQILRELEDQMQFL